MAAQDCKGYWYAATVLAVSDDSVPQYLVKFRGFPAAQNESVPKNRIRQNLTKAQIVQLNAAIAWGNSTAGLDAARGTWAVDKITAKKGRLSDGIKYLCTWQGWPASHTTWEPKRNLPSWLVADFERSQKQAVGADGKAAAPTGAPFVHAATEGTDATARRKHAPVTVWKDEIVREAGIILPKQKAAGQKQIIRMICSAWAFVDLHHLISELAAKLELPVATADLVTPIASERGAAGGKHVTDSFYIMSYGVIHELMGPNGTDALALRENNTAAMLIPPLKFAFKTVRDAKPARCQLFVTAEFGCFVWGSKVWDFVKPKDPTKETWDERVERGTKEFNHSRAIAMAVIKLAEAKEGLVPAAMVDWLKVV